MKIQPNFIMIYASFVSSTICGGQFIPLLKIVPIKKTVNAPYIYIQFSSYEFIKTNIKYLSQLKFNLRSHTGSYIEFDNDINHPVLLNLAIKV